MKLAERIKQFREEKGFSQEDIAEKLSVSRQAISKWEAGQSEPTTQNLLQLAEVLNVDVNILLNESRERKLFTKENIEQKGMRTVLNKRNAIFLTASCSAQMAIFCVNPEEINAFKYIMAAISGLFIVLLLANIWFTTETATRNKLYVRVFVFAIAFQGVMQLVNHFMGGLIAIIICSRNLFEGYPPLTALKYSVLEVVKSS